MEKIKANKRFITIKFTHEEITQLFQCIGQANEDGDHREWMESAGATKKELAALDNVMDIIEDAQRTVYKYQQSLIPASGK